ncbi:hypothetical protein HIM_04087 [Hirsutella minnesotensis 3608]|uniref:FAD-binding PCMH-type domain-containing protein n=1 Tax=Hirsutella minnesotensis 3608 TaxID=1043627 RepID=A0A0F7ZVC2_9HYPO|nr:hypothetical protein HIM_04087 [Hirsutella minnesotensis 3608]
MSTGRGSQLRDVLTQVLGDDLLQPDSEQYERDNGSYFSAFENELRPSHIAKPTSVEQIECLLKALRPYLLDETCRIAIRGQGHTPFAGSANITGEGSVTIDMRGLKGIALNPDNTTVEIAAGETWESVYAELEKHGLTTPGGRVGRIGVAGFILGGGLSMFSTRLGFACDSVIEFRVVLADGRMIRANAHQNADLWISLKGGLNNFGIVTSIVMRTIKSGKIWGGVTYYMPDALPQLLENTYQFVHDDNPDEDTHIMCSAGYGFGHQALTCVMYHTEGKVNPPALQPFTSLQPQIDQMGTLRVSSHLGFSQELSKFSSDGMRQYWSSITIRPDVTLMQAFYDRWQDTVSALKDAEGFIFSLGFHPLTKALLVNSQKAGENAMKISPSEGPLLVVLINPCWADRQDDARIFEAVETLVADYRRIASARGLLHRYIFTNYAHSKDKVMEGYGDIDKLKGVSQKYDPQAIFQKVVPGSFKLF